MASELWMVFILLAFHSIRASSCSMRMAYRSMSLDMSAILLMASADMVNGGVYISVSFLVFKLAIMIRQAVSA